MIEAPLEWRATAYILHPSVKSYADLVSNPERRKYTRADLVEAAIKRALEGAAKCCDAELRNTAMLLSNPPQSSAAWDAANCIRRLDPAQFIEEEKE